MSDPTVRLAAAQVAPVFLDRDATIAKAVSVIEEAGRAGAQVVAFPETWVPGYPMWIFGAAGWDDPASKRAFARLQANAIEVPSPATDTLCAAARRAGVMVVMGINERDVTYSRGTLYNSRQHAARVRLPGRSRRRADLLGALDAPRAPSRLVPTDERRPRRLRAAVRARRRRGLRRSG